VQTHECVDSDASLVRSIRTGDAAAFEELYRRTWSSLVGFAQSLLDDSEAAAEIVGDVFAGIWLRRDAWRPVTVDSYLFGAVRNRALNHRRTMARARLATQRAVADDGSGAHSVPAPDANLETAERLRAVQVALNRLAEAERTLLTLRWQRQMPWDDIARVLGVSSMAVQQQHSRLLKRLRVAVDALLG
jgi:RNA polymerase sigma-70 factor (ECF subfamily)